MRNDQGSLRDGAAMVNITFQAGTHLAGSGFGEYRPAQSVIDPLYAKAIAFETDSARPCIITMDVTIATTDYSQRIRRAVADHTGIPHEAIMVHAT